ncbi:MAG: pyruvate dehydrogenase [Candidatus Rokubacteria bacterium RIFCSPLOWO2_12_FULL_71_19]|nr:MAG: pyruvate dehydrogenase [Candidatus Rokubacteria bacterium RIFCSPLOWO2_12_FULL_71_19]
MTPAADLALLDSIQRRVLWLATWMIHHANVLRPNPDGTKVGGHQASSASLTSVLTALYFHALRPGDVVAVKPHAAPAFYAIQYLLGRLPAEALGTLRAFGGLQAYPSRRKNPEIVDLSTGSMGLGAVAASFGALATRYLDDHFGVRHPARFIALVGDAELDEGNVWEALLEEAMATLGNLLWIVDLNRQSLDRVAPDGRRHQLAQMFAANGWHVIRLRWGGRLRALFESPGGSRLRQRLEGMSGAEYHALLRCPPAAARKLLVTSPEGMPDAAIEGLLSAVADEELPALCADVGGHDLAAILAALDEAERQRDRPSVILADTIKGWGLPLAADPGNHGALLTLAQVEALRAGCGIAPGREWEAFPPESREAALIRGRPARFSPPPPRSEGIEVPERLEESYPEQASTQEAFGRVLGALARRPAGDRIVTLSPDVAVTTHLAGWINRKGVYAPTGKREPTVEAPQAMQWKESPAGQHVEIGIAEHNLFLALGAFGLTGALSGVTLLPVGTLYDPFVARGLDALYHALYSGAQFIVAATPSGVSLAPEGGAHQSVITPGIGIALPGIVYHEPVFACEVEWILLDALRQIAARQGGESLYLRLSTKPVEQALAPPATDEQRVRVLRGGYRLVDGRADPCWDPEANAVHIFAAGVMVPEAVAASQALREEGVYASVFAATSPDLLYRGARAPRPYLEQLVSAEEEGVPVVSVLDGHSHGLAFIGAALGVPQIPLGVDHFGQSGTRRDLYRHYGIDPPAIARAALTLLGR